MKTTLTCINCPLGCEVAVTLDAAGGVASVSGNECARGKRYAEAEVTNPLRVLTTTVRLRGGETGALPVKTAAAIPKGLVRDAASALRDVCVDAPARAGAVILSDVCGTGVDVVATRNMARK